ncbi:aromatic amino acid DMT transporter YddG [Vibrio sp.]|uniref:aromatic amino acid DMT transporter YddG n=1 Tax=Vibrio sp. TaxID=678 RepID=UPI003D122D6B
MNKYTLAGCGAIFLWSTTIGFFRNVTEQLGPIGGSAMVYTVASVMLVLFVGLPKIGRSDWRYLLIGGAMFVLYEICLSLALAMAHSRMQAIEMSVINYLWPSLTVLLAVIASRKPVNWLLYPAMALSFLGVAWTLGGEQNVSLSLLMSNFRDNPVSYSLALAGAFIWAMYCNVTKRMANGKNAVSWFFIATSVTLWIHYAQSDEPAMVFNLDAGLDLLLAAAVMGSGYALWNIGITGGNMVFLATLSYFTPILSTFFSALILNVELTGKFWQGVAMVTLASLACWWLTREQDKTALASQSSTTPTS